MIMEKKREQWLDNIRAMSCIFVVATHLLESLVRSNVLEDNVFHIGSHILLVLVLFRYIFFAADIFIRNIILNSDGTPIFKVLKSVF